MRIGRGVMRRVGAFSGYLPQAKWAAPTGFPAPMGKLASPVRMTGPPKMPPGLLSRPAAGTMASAAPPAAALARRVNPAVRGVNRALAGRGKYAAGAIAAGMAINVIRTRSGAGADKPRGRPTGMYQY